jgi:putative heme-binding domain-containing protein
MQYSRIYKSASHAALVVGFCLTTGAFAQSLPEGPGKAQVERVCSACHGLEIITKTRLDKPGWEGLVDDMVSRGAQGTRDDLQKVVTYLSTNFGKPHATQPVAPATQGPATASDAPPASSEDVLRGRSLVVGNRCLTCHRIADQGSRVGPDLTAIGANRSAEDLQNSLTKPDAEVLPENRYARVVTRDGGTVTGRLLNQDGFSVQIIDSGEQLRSFLRTDLREYKIIEKGLMPSYAGDLSASEIADVVKYLSSLK